MDERALRHNWDMQIVDPYEDVAGTCPHCFEIIPFKAVTGECLLPDRGPDEISSERRMVYDILVSTVNGQYRLLGFRRCKYCLNFFMVSLVPGHQFARYKDELEPPEVDRFTTWPPQPLFGPLQSPPPKINEALQEAIRCFHHHAYKACAVMLRRTLELVCDDRGLKGNNLAEKINSARDSLGVPPAFTNAMHDLRMFGNDAAHVSSKDYSEIDEVLAKRGIGVTYEIIRGIYGETEATLRSLNGGSPPPV